MSAGVGAGHERGRDGRATSARALVEFGRNRLLYSLILSRTNCVFRKTSLLRRRGDLYRRVSLPVKRTEQKVKELRCLPGKPGAQPPNRDYSTVQTIVNMILLRLTIWSRQKLQNQRRAPSGTGIDLVIPDKGLRFGDCGHPATTVTMPACSSVIGKNS